MTRSLSFYAIRDFCVKAPTEFLFTVKLDLSPTQYPYDSTRRAITFFVDALRDLVSCNHVSG